MTYSLDPISASTLKAEAKTLREERGATGAPLSHGEALEHVARAHGYRDWNTARAALPDRFSPPAQVGTRVSGVYLGQDFTGTVIGVEALATAQLFRVTVKFDDPVNVVTSKLFAAYRQRVTAVLDVYGVSPARSGNGEAQMRIERLR